MLRPCHAIFGLALSVVALPCLAEETQEPLVRARTGPARNAVVVVGDGMGIPVVTAARIHAWGPGGRLAMELPNVALVRTFSLDRMVADSAATATALFSGLRVRSGTIGMTPPTRRACSLAERSDGSPNPNHPCGENAIPMRSLADLAIRAGMAVGVVTTSRVTHATAAAFYAHVDERGDEPQIARQLVDIGDLSFVAGGGRRFFVGRDDDRDLLTELTERGYTVVLTGGALRRVVSERAERIVALLDDDHLPFEAERAASLSGKVPDIAELTDLAIRHLSRHPGGYLLLVEGGRIDHALHGNVARVALEETLALDASVAGARARTGDDTLILVTADHGHPLALVGYALVDDPVLGLARSAEGPEARDADGDGKPDFARALDGKGMTTLLFANGPGHGDDGAAREDPIELGEGVEGPRYRQESGVPLRYSTHEGSDVMASAVGPGSESVRGFLDQTDLFRIVRAALGL
jgi:alkaline phosphatase